MFKFGSRQRIANGSVCGYSGGSGAGAGGSSISGSAGFGMQGRGGNGETLYNPIFDDLSEGTIIEQFMPVDPRRLHRIWRRIYLQDPIAGPAIELMRDLPWSSWELTGIDDPAILRFYEDAFNAIGAVALMPELTGEFLVMGKYIAHLIFDDSRGLFTSCIVHDPDHVKVIPTPIPGWQPKLDLIPTPEMTAWANSQDPRDIAAQEALGSYTEELRRGGEIPLMPENTIYVPRRMSRYDYVGASVFTRILMPIAYEKALVNSSISTAKRRAGRIRHIKIGIDGTWEPTPQVMQEIADAFMRGDEDPVGAIVTTRTGVETSEVGGNTLNDIVKISDEWEFLQKAKMNALGISEELMNGTATYNNMETLLSVFLDRMRALRSYQVSSFLDEIAKRLARKHEYVRRSEAEIRHGIRIRRAATDISDEELILPDYAFSKTLRPVANRDYMEILSQIEEKGIPVTVSDWAAAAGYSLDNVDKKALERDLQQRKTFSAHRQQVQLFAGSASSEEGGGGGDFGSGGAGLDFGGGGSALEDLGLGGGEAGGGEDIGGGEAAGGGSEGGGEGLKASSFQAAQKIRQLRCWDQNRQFLGLTERHALRAMDNVHTLLGADDKRVVGYSDIRKQIKTGSIQTDQLILYVLGRAGIIQNVMISRDVAGTIGAELAKNLTGAELMNELDQLNRLAYRHSGGATKKIVHTPHVPAGNSSLLLTGVTFDKRVLGS